MTNKTTILTATATPGVRGQQYVAAITGRDKRYTFSRTFIGSRATSTTEAVVGPGLYEVRCVEQSKKVRNGGEAIVSDRYVVVWMDGIDVASVEIEQARALESAHEIETGARQDWRAIGASTQIARYEMRIAEAADRADDQVVNLKSQIGSLAPGSTTRGAIRAAQRAEIARLRGEVAHRPLELDALPSDPAHRRAALESERAKLLARLAEIDAALEALA